MVAILKEDVPAMRAMRLEDLESVVAIETQAYDFPWTLGIFRDCLRAGYECWVLALPHAGDRLQRAVGRRIRGAPAERLHCAGAAWPGPRHAHGSGA
jgi:ribosomal-protein-alanine N-acetyltransferase